MKYSARAGREVPKKSTHSKILHSRNARINFYAQVDSRKTVKHGGES